MTDTNMHKERIYVRVMEIAVHIIVRIKFMISALIPSNQTRNPLEKTPLNRLPA